MISLKKRNLEVDNLLKNSCVATKIKIYFSTQSVDASFDPYEKNYTKTNLNPLTIKGYVSDIKPEALVWKEYGLTAVGAKEILCDEKFAEWFKKANKIEIEGDNYSCFKDGLGVKNAIITKRPFKLIRVVLFKQ